MTARAAIVLAWIACALAAGADQIIFDDAFQNGWQAVPWAEASFTNAFPAHDGSFSIAVDCQAFEGLSLRAPDMDASPYSALSLWLNGGDAGGQVLTLQALANHKTQPAVTLAALAPNLWTNVSIPLSALGVASATNFDGLSIYNAAFSAIPTFYADDIALQSPRLAFTPAAPRQDGQVEFWLNASGTSSFVLQQSPDFVHWLPVATNTVAPGPAHFLLPAAAARQFYRAVSAP